MLARDAQGQARLRRATVILLALCGFANVQAEGPPDRSVAYLSEHTWSSPSGGRQARGLFLFESSAAGLVSRFLIESPGGERIVLTNDLSVEHSRDRLTLRDDETGWWFQVVQRYDVEASGLREFLSETMDWYTPVEGRTVTMTARSRGGLHLEREVPIQMPPSRMYTTFVEELRAAGLEQQLREEIPPSFTEAIAFLDAAFLSHAKRSLVEILTGVAPEAAARWDYEALDWEESEGRSHRGVEVTAPELLELTSKFGSIDGRNPLSDAPLDVLGPRADTGADR